MRQEIRRGLRRVRPGAELGVRRRRRTRRLRVGACEGERSTDLARMADARPARIWSARNEERVGELLRAAGPASGILPMRRAGLAEHINSSLVLGHVTSMTRGPWVTASLQRRVLRARWVSLFGDSLRRVVASEGRVQRGKPRRRGGGASGFSRWCHLGRLGALAAAGRRLPASNGPAEQED